MNSFSMALGDLRFAKVNNERAEKSAQTSLYSKHFYEFGPPFSPVFD